jgi:uncharacterized protein YuzE
LEYIIERGTMKITLDRKGDAAYIYLIWPLPPSSVARTYPCDPYEAGAEINLDFDSTGKLLGIEVLDASKHLPLDLLKDSEIIG